VRPREAGQLNPSGEASARNKSQPEHLFRLRKPAAGAMFQADGRGA
jgi:hypothetical protein